MRPDSWRFDLKKKINEEVKIIGTWLVTLMLVWELWNMRFVVSLLKKTLPSINSYSSTLLIFSIFRNIYMYVAISYRTWKTRVMYLHITNVRMWRWYWTKQQLVFLILEFKSRNYFHLWMVRCFNNLKLIQVNRCYTKIKFVISLK